MDKEKANEKTATQTDGAILMSTPQGALKCLQTGNGKTICMKIPINA